MATNPYFRTYDSKIEQQLINNLTVETIKSMGRDVVYIPRDYLIIDNIFGEDPESKFSEGFPIEAYILNVDRFDGNRDIISKFGIQITDRMQLDFSKTRFEEEITSKRNEIKKPRTGDLVYLPLSGSLFEVNYVEDELPFYQLGGLTTYRVTLELFVYDGESIDTGITSIDIVEDYRKSFATFLHVNYTPILGGTFELLVGETAYQVYGITGAGSTLSVATSTATILNFVRGTTQNDIYLTGISGNFSYGITQSIKGSVSGAEYYMKGSATGSNIVIPTSPDTGNNVNDNDILQSSGLDIFDFTDVDPFSSGNY